MVKKGRDGVRVIVVGAGLGGLTLAHGLRRAGIEVVVVERDGAGGRRQGVSLHLDDRGSSALRACLPPEHVAMIESTSGGPRERGLLLSDVDGELAVVDAVPLDGAAGRTRPGRQVHRPLLRAVLLAGLADVVRFGTEVTGFDHRADGTVRVRFADGATDVADVLVGADGIGSAVRRRHLPHVRVVDTGRRMLMGATPLRAVAATGLPDLLGHSPGSVRAGGTVLAMGALRFTEPPVAARERWLPALPAGAVDGVEDYLMWAVPAAGEQPGTPSAVWRRARDLVAGLHPVLRSAVDRAWPELTVALRIGVVPPVPIWPAGPVTYIGDALRAAPGFGGNLALRDARLLRDGLVVAARGERDLRAVLADHDRAMRGAAEPVVAGSGA